MELAQPDSGVQKPPDHLVDIPIGFDVNAEIAVQLLGLGDQFLCACGVLLWSHAVMLSSQRDRCCLPVRQWAAVRRLGQELLSTHMPPSVRLVLPAVDQVQVLQAGAEAAAWSAMPWWAFDGVKRPSLTATS
ncbi:hypothetical protein [Actinoplanes regularis]|uniref:hypothetical protein n=1 Tax=Actinoplanes regularis TaxID=52697 RepID=UPI002556ED55|nr:hypothetical protein [Actinoplanes regularis]